MTEPRTSPVTFRPPGKTVEASSGERLVEAANAVALTLDMPCGGEGVCGKCRVRVSQGAGPPGPQELRVFSQDELEAGWRLACQTVVAGPMAVEVPHTSLLATFHKILSDTRTAQAVVVDPPVWKRRLALDPPSREDDRADLVRLREALGPVAADLELVRHLPRLLRQSMFRGTAVLAPGRLLDFEPGDTRDACYAAAVDVGTTTLAAVLIDLHEGSEMAVAACLNPQTPFGDDVISRIAHSQDHPEGLEQLRSAVCRAIDGLIGEMTSRASVKRHHIYEVVLAGNTTMQHLLCGIDPRHLGELPFVAATGCGVTAPAAALDLAVHPGAEAYVAPVIGGFVGGDSVAGMLATEMTRSAEPSLLVDIGTNGELVLSCDSKLWAVATAAGPAFEGARIEFGMRAARGAIERFHIDGDVHFEVIGGGAPLGICGSALIDVAAELLRYGFISPEGRLARRDALPSQVPAALRDRAVEHQGDPAFLIVTGDRSGTGRPILFTQRDVRQLQLASGAIRAGVAILCKRAGMAPGDLRRVEIAGGFGNYIRRRNAQRIGLLPPEIPRECIRFQGNTSLAGARLMAISLQARREAEQLARRTEHFDLATDHAFQWTFADAMIFPSEPRAV